MIIMMMIIIFAQEALLTEMVSRAILKKTTGEHMFPGVIVCPTIHLPVRLRLLGDALTTCKSVSWSQKTHSYMTAGFKPLRGAKRTYEQLLQNNIGAPIQITGQSYQSLLNSNQLMQVKFISAFYKRVWQSK